MDITTALAEAKRPERVVPVCFRGDLLAELADAERQLADAEREATIEPSLADAGRKRELAEQIEAVRAHMADASVPFRLRAMSRQEWTKLLRDAPPEPTPNAVQLGLGDTQFFTTLVRRSVVDPVLNAAQWDQLLDETLTSAQFDSLAEAAWELNRGEVSVPFSRSALRALTSTASG